MGLIFFGGIGALLAVMVTAMSMMRWRAQQNVQSLAAQLGLEFVPAPTWFAQPAAFGQRRTRMIKVFSYSVRLYSTFNQSRWVAISASPAGNGGLTFTLHKRNPGTRLNNFIVSPPVVTGDPEFDHAWYVETNRPVSMRTALTLEVRTQLVEAQRAGANGKFRLEDSTVAYSEQSFFISAERAARFVAVADVLCDLASLADGIDEAPGH